MDAELPAAVPHQRLMMMMIFGEIPKERFSGSIKALQTQPLFTALIFHTHCYSLSRLHTFTASPTMRSSIFKSLLHPSSRGALCRPWPLTLTSGRRPAALAALAAAARRRQQTQFFCDNRGSAEDDHSERSGAPGWYKRVLIQPVSLSPDDA